MRKMIVAGWLLGLALLGAGCEEEGASGVLIDAEGAVNGVVWLDRNGNGEIEATDGPVRDVRVELVPGVGQPLFTTRSGESGQFSFPVVPVGEYVVRVDSATAGDSLQVLRLDSAEVTVGVGDTASVLVGFTYPTVAVDTARQRPFDTRVFVEGRALNGWGTFADSTLHVRDSGGAIRAVRVPPLGVSAGDSVRLLGTVSLQATQPVLRDPLVFTISTGVQSPAPVPVSAATAASANAGLLDADLVRLESVVIRDSTRNAAGERILIVEDESGTVEVLLDAEISFVLNFPTEMVGTILDVTGLLVPDASMGGWVVKPRGGSDLIVGDLSYPLLSVDEAREGPVDTRIQVEGLALNGWNVFGDSTVHLRDATGSLRALRVPPVAMAAGDSVRLLGTTAVVRGQTILSEVRTTLLEQGLETPEPDTVTAAGARNAGGGALDAALIHLDSVVVRDTTRTTAGERVLVVEDGTDSVRVVLDGDVPFQLTFATEIFGTILEVTGLLVPATTAGEWVVKPRGIDDIVVGPLSYPLLPVSGARDESVGTRLQVEGLALNAWNVFGDSVLHVRDTTGSIRALRVPQVAASAGDSIRILGTRSALRDQPILLDVRTTLLRQGLESPDPVRVDASTAWDAGGGALDAALVHLDSVVITDTTRTADGEPVFVVEDASGTVRVVLDDEVSFPLTFPIEIIGTSMDVSGLLVPSAATGGEWVVKPRGMSDIVIGPLSYPTLPVQDARAEAPETRLIVEGLALSPWNVFGDSTLHVADNTGAIRALRVPAVAIAAGDSISVLGTTTTARTQPVLKDVRATRIRTGVESPPADSIATVVVRTADSGALDAALVRVAGAVVQDTDNTATGDLILIVDDGSGEAQVVLDEEIGFFFDPATIVGSTVDATGLLVPSPEQAGVWILKPRHDQDLRIE